MADLRLRLLSYVIMAYMLLAFSWWACLLFTKNREAFYARRDLLKNSMITEGLISNDLHFEDTAEYAGLLKKFKRQERMIFGEASMFVITLLAGLWFINKSYQREVKSNNQRRNFLLSITHELKSPIASIRLVLETLMKRELSKPDTDKLASTGLIETERLNELIENLLLSAKLETAYQPHFEYVNLVELLEDLLAKLADKHPEVQLSFLHKESIPPVKLDRPGITSLVINLFENAVKYSADTPVVEVRLSANDKCATLEIADRGAGIPDGEKNRIFEKFYRIGSEETRQTKGTGLGLFIVREIVKAHKGRISVLDNIPGGTVFKVELPFS